MKKVDPEIINNYKQEISQNAETRTAYPEIAIVEQKGQSDPVVQINMDFLGIDLSKVPTQSLNDYKVYIIPILYVISSFVSIKMTTNMQNNKEDKKETSGENASEIEAMQSMNKSMTYMMPIMSVSIAVIAPLGLALYWLVSNVLMIVERLIIQKIMNSKEENENA